MARIRTIKPEMFQDEKLSLCDPLTRLVFVGLIAMADDAGRALANVRIVDAFIFPETHDTAGPALETLAGIGLIRLGLTASGQRVIQIVNWERHQKIQHPNHRASLPQIVDVEAVTAVHEALMRDSGGAHEALMSQSGGAHEPLMTRPTTSTNDQRPVPTTVDPLVDPADAFASDESSPEVVPVRSRRAPKVPPSAAKWPHFPTEVSNAVYDLWLQTAGAIDRGFLRKSFAPLFMQPESVRPPGLPRDAELLPAVALYLAATTGTRDVAFRTPVKCAASICLLVQFLREPKADDPVTRIEIAQSLLGVQVNRPPQYR